MFKTIRARRAERVLAEKQKTLVALLGGGEFGKRLTVDGQPGDDAWSVFVADGDGPTVHTLAFEGQEVTVAVEHDCDNVPDHPVIHLWIIRKAREAGFEAVDLGWQ